jgi:hypothetical protein
MQGELLVDSWPRMNTRFRTRPTDGCMKVRDARSAGWKGSGTCSPDQGKPNTGIPEHVRTEIQDAALTALPSQNEGPRQLSTSLTFNTTFSGPTVPDSDRRIHFHGDPERIANGLRIASTSAGHFASIPRSLSAVRIFLFTFWAKHAGPLPFGRIWRTPDPSEVRHKCVTGMPAEPPADASLSARTVASLGASPGPPSNASIVMPVAPSGGVSTRPPRVRRWQDAEPAMDSPSGATAAPPLGPSEDPAMAPSRIHPLAHP